MSVNNSVVRKRLQNRKSSQQNQPFSQDLLTDPFDFDEAGTFGCERTWRSHHILSPAGLDFSAPDLAIAPRPSTARKANAAGMKKISGRPTVATPRAPVRPPRALPTAVELMKITEAVATAVGSNRCAAMMPSDAKIPQTPPIRI